MIFRNHYHFLICCSINIYDYYHCWKELCCTIFLWKPSHFLFFRMIWWMESSKESQLFEILIVCNIIHVCTVTFDKCNVSLMNEIYIYNFKKSLQHHTNTVHYVKCDFYFCPLLIQMDVFHKVKSLFSLVSETSGCYWCNCVSLVPRCGVNYCRFASDAVFSWTQSSSVKLKRRNRRPDLSEMLSARLLLSDGPGFTTVCSTSNQPAAKAASHTAIMNLVEP